MGQTSVQTTSAPPTLLLSRHPVRSLTIGFGAWKALLFLAAAACPGPGYDTSTTLLPGVKHAEPLAVPLRFARWDSLYFLHTVQHGYVYEQEWAFGYGYTNILALLTSVIDGSGESGVAKIALVGVALSHLAHYLSVLALYRLSINVFGHQTTTQRLTCFLSAALHIITPGGAFLSAPNGEALFSFLNISGFYIYSSSFLDNGSGKRLASDVKLLIAAVFFAVATAVRSNGILSGFLFAYDALIQLHKIVFRGLSLDSIIQLSAIIIGGCIVALGMLVPQYIAYVTFCLAENGSRSWCQRVLPSIYTWVQDQYWNVGFLRYWTVSNLPLFLIAMPMLIILCRSSIWALKGPFTQPKDRAAPNSTNALLLRLAVPQGLLALLAFTSYHVQIINRISSGYPLWYWYLVPSVMGSLEESSLITHKRTFELAVHGMVIYALIQGVLFGSFLPPA